MLQRNSINRDKTDLSTYFSCGKMCLLHLFKPTLLFEPAVSYCLNWILSSFVTSFFCMYSYSCWYLHIFVVLILICISSFCFNQNLCHFVTASFVFCFLNGDWGTKETNPFLYSGLGRKSQKLSLNFALKLLSLHVVFFLFAWFIL